MKLVEEKVYALVRINDLSSISGSDSEKEDTLDTYAIAQGKIFLQNDKREVFSMYRCLLFDRKEEVSDEILITRLKECCVTNKQWTILMLGGGHFAGAVFRNGEPILHKTFHCYTVRAGQGGSQSARDGKSGGAQPKSAGASLRRYNEQSLVQHVKSIVETWKSEIEESSLVIYRASGPYNRTVLFGGTSPLLDRNNKKLRTIPFSTRRATFTEVKRVYNLLSTAALYGKDIFINFTFSKQKSPEEDSKRNKVRSSCVNRAKSRETVERPLPTPLSSDSNSEPELNEIDAINENFNTIELSSKETEISFANLQEFDDSLTPEQRKRPKKKPRKSKTKKLREQEEARKKELCDILFRGDLTKLKHLIEEQSNCTISEESGTEKDAFVNKVIDENSNTLLHVAALNEHVDIVGYLLENNANPCLKNKNQQTAYTCTQSKDIRNFLKEFAKMNPDKFNYNKANIPTNSLTNEEITEKKKAQRKSKKEKEKVKKKESEIKKKEEEEKDRFLKLSDREKRALAAERRILSQSGTVTKRCFLCAEDIAGKIPFEYMGNLFCSIECLKAHRMQHPLILS
nr:ankyrin repeat and zinc finger domain-containing protein 1-like [Leptinotarsa decemlineata]